MDFVIRVSYSEDLKNKIESIAETREELSEIQDRFYKPEGTELSEFSPKNVIVRKRKFPDRETLVKINIMKQSLGYTDTKQKVESLESLEKWGEFSSYAVEYEMENSDVSVLIETFSFGKYVKLEAPSIDALKDLIKELDLDESQVIEKNSAQMLAEDMNLI